MGETIDVLHVDDDRGVVETAAQFVEAESGAVTVTTEHDAGAALDRLAEGGFDCVVSDYDMPGMNGLEFLEAVRERDEHLPFILYTGKGSEEVASGAIAAGVTDYLQKGTGTEQYELLVNRIENAVERYRQRRRAANLERIRAIVRDVNQALVRASSREEIERRVCATVAGAEPYQLAVVGGYDSGDDRFVPRTAAGTGDESSRAVAAPDDGAPPDPVEVAAHDRRLAVTHDLEHDPFPDLDGVAVEKDLRAVAAAPLDYADERYGVFVVCSDRSRAFDERERELLEELAGDIAHAFAALETRDELARERDRRAALFENAPDPIVENTFDGDRPLIESVNAAFEEAFGHDAEEVRGRPVDEVVVPAAHQDEHERLRRRVRRGESIEREVRRETTDGVREFILRGIPVDVEGSSGAYVWYTDITERKERERELARAKERFQTIFEHSNDAIMILDPRDDEIRDANDRACELLGYSRDELLSLAPSAVHPDEVERFREFVAAVREEGVGWTDELACVTKERERIPVEVSASMVELDGRRHVLAVIRDVTDPDR